MLSFQLTIPSDQWDKRVSVCSWVYEKLSSTPRSSAFAMVKVVSINLSSTCPNAVGLLEGVRRVMCS